MLKRSALALSILLALWVLYSHQNPESPGALPQILHPKQTSPIQAPRASLHVTPPAVQTAKSDEPLERKLEKEGELIGHIDSNPEATESRLKDWARTLSEEDLKQLEKYSLDRQKSEDNRFLAVMLMGWSGKAEALSSLEDVALAKIDPLLSPQRFGEYEKILRMQAVEEILSLSVPSEKKAETLQSIANRTDEQLVADRAHRALWSLRGQAPTPAEQDQKALEELLKRPHSHH